VKDSSISKLALLILLALAVSPFLSAQSQIAGDWQGTLNAGGTQLRLVLHIVATKDGALTATLDSVDQRVNGIAVTAITLKDSRLSLAINAVHGSYDGTLNKDATEIDGTWSQGQPLALNFKRGTVKTEAKPAAPTDIDGTWLGSLDAGAMKLRLVLEITNTADGLTAKLQSPDQATAWIPADSVVRSNGTLTVGMKLIGATFEGKIAADLGSIEGTFTQGGNPMPLTVKRVKDQSALERPRPQNPVKPYPYREEEVSYTNKVAGDTMAATLTIPSGKGPFPAVLLIAGSGPHDRDESLMGHKPFLVVSDYLTRKGVVVLRADKRGVGKSTGDANTATSADFADDAEAGVTFLKTRPEVDAHRIGLIGHSEGGVIAPMVAARDRDVAFIVLMAGTGVSGDQILVEQGRLIGEANGESKEKAQHYADTEREVLTLVETEKDSAVLERTVREKLAGKEPDAQIEAQIKAFSSPWLRFFLTYDPGMALRKVTCPVLVLNGSLDLQVPPAQNLPAVRKALDEGGNKRYEIDELPGLNHLFQSAKTGSPVEYAEIEETISPVALGKMASWIDKQ
jgi:pimeloyl-ACP methyl ester carboxylesterase